MPECERLAIILKHYIMPDDLHKKKPQDASRINVHETYEMNYWTHTLGVSKAELEAAVKKVGTSAAAVRKHLGK
jgi:hypothetical protein